MRQWGSMRYISVCSGIEAASVAWSPLGWKAVAFSEIDAFPCAVLKHHYPETPNLGDLNRLNGRRFRGTDILVGGTPCQDFSIAGRREGLRGGKSSLARHFVRLVDEIRPRFFLWENVPGAVSTAAGNDFRTFLKALDELRYGMAWRILDAANFGVPQRRRRIFLLGCRRAVQPAVNALFEFGRRKGNATQGVETEEKNPLIIGTLSANAGGMTRPAGNCNELDFCIPTPDGRVRYITPTEAERLQGFPDGYTDVEFNGKRPSEGVRYKALGNSMAVPVMRWIGERIQAVENDA